MQQLRGNYWHLVNTANLVLIPKKEGCNVPGDYRLLSLMHSKDEGNGPNDGELVIYELPQEGHVCGFSVEVKRVLFVEPLKPRDFRILK